MPGHFAIFLSTMLIVIFGEILPQAICSGPNKLKIAEKMSCLIRWLMCLLSWIAYPMGYFLEWLIGKEGVKKFMRKDLKSLVELHQISHRQSSLDCSEKVFYSFAFCLQFLNELNFTSIISFNLLKSKNFRVLDICQVRKLK